MRPPRYAFLGATLLATGTAPSLRLWLEADMARHMLVQFPLLIVAGAAFASTLPPRVRAAVATINAHGLAGLLLCLLVSAFWMIPRALDQALLSPPMEIAKIATLLAAGGALQLSWRPAGIVVQIFFIGNWAWMTAVVGLLYQDMSTRLCNGYLLDQQIIAGQGLVVLAIALPTAFIALLAKRGVLAGDASETTQGCPTGSTVQ
ncbi:hypothetical protein [Aromatoleum petrolei]|uniref:Transmembrane protein n=1 Tax=Aromatoleum petrolei TaxID=76116 RepID=A0ABX1MNV5_9RHOO|nr:hypothetical protein [Aromatoleum petrolei]NMF89627.1 hypothetical protein [Aromatoleum petrolei]QTQ39067.1 Uncharacterized protein ToN1_49740 [Aromatoleum petrolei]